MQNTPKDILKHRLETTTIGIWGFGKTGQSVLKFLAPRANSFFITDSKPFKQEQRDLITSYANAPIGQAPEADKTNTPEGLIIQIIEPEFLPQFFALCGTVIASPGIDITPYLELYPDLFVSELDVFAAYTTTPYIAITGSVGKTTTVHLLTQMLSLLGMQVQAIGNIGTPMLDALQTDISYDYFIIETSSFQLEHIKLFAPHIAAILNITENHLDRHKIMEQYLHAKGQLLAHQTENDTAILPMEYINAFWPFVHQQKVQWINEAAYDDIIKPLLDITCKENLIIILAIIEHLGFDISTLAPLVTQLSRPAHRMELVRTYNGITFYNDSKSTTPASTLQAVQQCAEKPTILLLGGLSKGIDRKPLIGQLRDMHQVKIIICFGAEAEQLHAWCQEIVLESVVCPTLESALTKALEHAQQGDTVLLSPAGSSFDLFKNFEERGNQFKALVNGLNN